MDNLRQLFVGSLNLAVAASWLIAALLLLRPLLKKLAPKWVLCALWGLVAVCLMCPVLPESVLSVRPQPGQAALPAAAAMETASPGAGITLTDLAWVWLVGMAAVLALPPSLRSGWPLYLWGGLTATSVEYIYHWWGETFLSVSFWDYTGVFGNLRGRVCLPFSLAWGLLLFPAVYLVTPPVLALADRVPVGVTWWLLLAFTADAVCSLRFLAVTHDLEALRAAVWPVPAKP